MTELMEALGSHLEHGVVVVDAEQVVRYANPAALQLGSFNPEWRGRRLADATRDYRLVRIAGTCLETGEETRRELFEVSPNRTLDVEAVPVEHEGARSALLLIRDQSRIARVESMRRDFVANVSHELRTPITAIQLLVETMQNEHLVAEEVSADFIAKIGLEVRHMAQMVEELLELSAIESGRRPLSFRETSMGELLSGIERLRPLARERGLRLQVYAKANLPTFSADSPRLAQVLRNLVHNAIKFTPRDGVVTVRAAYDRHEEAVRISVSDTGVGIDPQDLSRIFERFWKADRSRGRDGEGTGLGLAIARHIVEAHGGRITVHSEPRRGATFTVLLPVRAAPAAPAAT